MRYDKNEKISVIKYFYRDEGSCRVVRNEVIGMTYRYGGGMDPGTKKKMLHGFLAVALAMSVFADAAPAQARRHHDWYSYYFLPDGTLTAHRNHYHGWGDFDDFAMYHDEISSEIPVRDDEVRAGWKTVRDEYLGSEPNGIVPMLKKIKEATETRTDSQAKEGKGKYDIQVAISLKGGNLKDLISQIRDPKTLLQGVQVVIKDKRTSVNPDMPPTGPGQSYTKEEVEDGTKIIEDKLAYLRQSHADTAEAYKKTMEEMEETRKKLEQLVKAEDDSGKESPVSASERQENIRRLEFALKQQKETLDAMDERLAKTNDAILEQVDAIEDWKTKQNMHMATTHEIVNDIREKREKYSTSRDLGYRKFGQKKKADFSKILDNAIEPKPEDKGEGKTTGLY